MKTFYSLFFAILICFPLFVISQNVGINTATPASKLAVKGNLSIGNNYSGTAAPADGLLIEGNVGIGLMSPLGKLHVLSTTADTTLILENTSSGGFSAKFKGIADFTEVIKNTGTNFAGSVAVNDGLTVGDIISSSSCTPNIDANCSLYYWDGLSTPPYNFNIEPESFLSQATEHIRTYTSSCNLGDCRNITKVKMTATFYEQWDNAVNVACFLRGISTFIFFKANVAGTNTPVFDTTAVFVDSTTLFNNTDPSGDWIVRLVSIDQNGDSDGIHEYTVNIYYKYANITATGGFAAYGQVKASGSLFANSSHEYGDVAEFMKVRELNNKVAEAGDLVSIDPENPQSFVLSTKANDPLLIGAISKNPSLYINSPDAGKPIALTGRVEVKVNSEGGVIKPGDPITSSSIPGVGMKMNQTGTVLGYALEAFDGSMSPDGKVWILLARGHHEGIDRNIRIVEGKDENLGGLEIQGAKKVTDEKEIFVAWKESVIDQLPSDIDFDDLVINLNSFGGNAQLIVKSVNKDGFTVSIGKKSSSMKGFYYTVNFVSPMLYKEEVSAESKMIADKSTDDEKAKSLYQLWNDKTKKLIEKSGRSHAELTRGLSAEEIAKIKKEVPESWKKADRKLYEERLAIGYKLEELMKTNPGIRFTE